MVRRKHKKRKNDKVKALKLLEKLENKKLKRKGKRWLINSSNLSPCVKLAFFLALLNILQANPNFLLKHGDVTMAINRTNILKQHKNKKVIASRWLHYIMKQFKIKKYNKVGVKMISTAVMLWEEAIKNGKKRIIFNPSSNRMMAVNQYIAPILNKVLSQLDDAGFDINSNLKFSKYKDILRSPKAYLEFGAKLNSGFKVKDTPKSVEDYTRSHFLRLVYITKKRRISKKILSLGEALYESHYHWKNSSIHFHLFLSKNYNYWRNIFLSKVRQQEINIQYISAFNHSVYGDQNVTPEMFEKTLSKMIEFEEVNNIDLVDVIQNVDISKIECEKFNFNQLIKKSKAELQIALYNIHKETKKSLYHQNVKKSIQISNLIDRLIKLCIPLVVSFDQTSVVYGSSGLNFICTQKKNPCLRQSNAPRTCGSALIVQNGGNKWPLGFVYKLKTKATDERIIQLEKDLFFNNPVSPVNTKKPVWSSTGGSFDGRSMYSYFYVNWPKIFPKKVYKFVHYDASKINLSNEMTIFLDENNAIDVVCPSYLTCEKNVPDDRIINLFKNGSNKYKTKGVKQIIQEKYNFNGTESQGGPPVNEKNVILPLRPEVVFNIAEDVHNSLPGKIMLESFHRLGIFLPFHFSGYKRLKKFVLQSILIKIKSLKKYKDLYQKKSPVEIKNLAARIHSDIKNNKNHYQCPGISCKSKFKAYESYLEHTSVCTKIKTKHPIMANADANARIFSIATALKETKKKAHLIRKKKGWIKKKGFKCPGKNCGWHRASDVNQVAKTVSYHIATCPHLKNNDFIKIFATCKLFAPHRY